MHDACSIIDSDAMNRKNEGMGFRSSSRLRDCLGLLIKDNKKNRNDDEHNCCHAQNIHHVSYCCIDCFKFQHLGL